MANFFTISAISQKRHLELVNEKSDDYDSADAYYLAIRKSFLKAMVLQILLLKLE